MNEIDPNVVSLETLKWLHENKLRIVFDTSKEGKIEIYLRGGKK